MKAFVLLTAATMAAALPESAYGQATTLKAGLSGRVMKIDGVKPEYDEQQNVNAGYYRIVVEDAGSSQAAICPRTKYNMMPATERKRWQSAEEKIYKTVFDKNVAWSLVGEFAVASPTGNIKNTLRFASIEKAEDVGCNPKIGDGGTIGYKSFLLPINRSLYHFGNTVSLNLKVNNANTADKNRVKNAWDGISLAVSTFIPGAGILLEGLAPTGQKEINGLLDQSNVNEWSVTLDHNPGEGVAAGAYYVDLGFFHDDIPQGQPGNHGVIIKIDYVGSVFANGKFLKPLYKSAAEIVGTQVKLATGPKGIADLLGASGFADLKSSPDASAFNENCKSAVGKLLENGISETDAAIFVKAVGLQNGNVADKLHKVNCLVERNAMLKSVGMEIEPKADIVLKKPTLPQLHANLDLFGGILQAAEVKPVYATAFAPEIRIFADSRGQALLGLNQMTTTMTRDDALDLFARKFSNIGCFAPRSARPELVLSVRPGLQQTGTADRTGAAVLKIREKVEGQGDIFIGSFIVGGIPDGGNPEISFVSITEPGVYKDDILKEITENRRTVSCNEQWMDPLFVR